MKANFKMTREKSVKALLIHVGFKGITDKLIKDIIDTADKYRIRDADVIANIVFLKANGNNHNDAQ